MVQRYNTHVVTAVDSLTASASLSADFIPLLTTIFKDSPDGVSIYSVNGALVYANQSLLNTLGASLQQAQLNPLLNRLKPYQDALIHTLNTSEPSDFLLEDQSLPLQRPLHDLIVMTAIKNSDELVLGVLVIGRNLSEYRQQQFQALAQKERYQRALIDNFPFMVWLKDIDSRYLAINNAFASLIGVTYPEEAIGKTDYDYFPKKAADANVALDREVLQTGEPKIMVDSMLGDGGKPHWAEVYKSPVVIDGEVVGTVGLHTI